MTNCSTPLTIEPCTKEKALTSKTVDLFRNDPIGYFDGSITKMHTLPREELEVL